MNIKRIISSVGIGAGAIIIGLGVQYALANWSPAPPNPPSNNTPAPINVGTSPQAKNGSLSLGTSVATSTIPLDVEGIGYLQALIVGKNVAKTFQYLDGNQGPGKVLTSDANGNASWQAGAGSSSSANISYISLSGNNSGNNTGIVANVSTLSAGTYTFSGSGTTHGVGGGGFRGIIVSTSPSLTYYDLNNTAGNGKLDTYYGAPVTSGTGSSYRAYYNDTSHPDIIYMLKSDGYIDSPSLFFTIPPTTITVPAGTTEYVYEVLGQSSMDGGLLRY
jgi:hypothetical protein